TRCNSRKRAATFSWVQWATTPAVGMARLLRSAAAGREEGRRVDREAALRARRVAERTVRLNLGRTAHPRPAPRGGAARDLEQSPLVERQLRTRRNCMRRARRTL